MSQRKEAWNTKENAEVYDRYALNFPMYKETSRDLVSISGIQPGMTVIDLAAGTGVTTQAIINQTSGKVRIIAVDQAGAMINKAKEKFSGRDNIRFIVSEAENLDKVVSEPVDAVICNSAFWQMKAKKVFKHVSNVLKQNGIFAFNLPDQFFSYQNFKKQPRNPLPYDSENLIVLGKEVGLTLVNQSVKEYSKNVNEIIAFNQIPVMQKNFSSEKEKKGFIDDFKKEKETHTRRQHQWVYFVFRKKKRKSRLTAIS